MKTKVQKILCSATCLTMCWLSQQEATAETIFGVDASNRLLSFESGNPNVPQNSVLISGVLQSEAFRAIDLNPYDGELYGYSTAGRIYNIDTQSGATTYVTSWEMRGDQVGFDFRPGLNQFRLVNPFSENVRIDIGTGRLVISGRIDFGVGAIAYDNSFSGSGTPPLFAIRLTDSSLYSLNGDGGTLTRIGALGAALDLTESVSFDISEQGTAFATFRTQQGAHGLYQIDLASGAATFLGNTPAPLVGMTAVPEPSTIALISVAGILATQLWRRRAGSVGIL